MSRRFFVSHAIGGEQAVLDGQEAHHLLHVLRAEVGDEVILFDGMDCEYVAAVTRRQRDSVTLTISEKRSVSRELRVCIELGVALPKGDRQRWLVEKCVELGCRRLVPLVTSRGVAQPTSSALGRLQRTVIEASKQSGRNRLMELAPPTTWRDYVATRREPSLLDGSPAAAVRWLAVPRASQSVAAAESEVASPNLVRLAVGPEGGFTDEEISTAAAHQWKSVHLGARILRVETAAVALVARWSLNVSGA